MVRLVTVDDVNQLVHRVGVDQFFLDLIEYLREDFLNWDTFQKSPRHANHFPFGVLELMPICSEEFFAYKYVNGHPGNPKNNRQTIVAMGMLADVASGYPLMISEMTLLTAFRTAATTALVSQYLARKNARVLALIGCGAQAEFQAKAMKVGCHIERIQYYDIDPKAMKKFAKNMALSGLELVACASAQDAVANAHIITTCTADKTNALVLMANWLEPGQHINGLGGDCPGKTEWDSKILTKGQIYVEYLEQTKDEGEIQHLKDTSHCIEIHEVMRDQAKGRTHADQITLYDSVGFSLEDYSVLRYVYQLACDFDGGTPKPMIPSLLDPKDLYAALQQARPIERAV